MSAAVIIPMRSLGGGKGRLGEVLDTAERRALTEGLFRTVLSAAAPLVTLVVTADPAVADIVDEMGGTVVKDSGGGLIDAVHVGVGAAGQRGHDRVVVAHADLPFPDGLVALGDSESSDDIVLVPDRHGDGTNVISVGSRRGFRFQYGPGSFERHLAEARRLGTEPTVVTDSRLSWDVDMPEDLHPPKEWGPVPWTRHD